MSTRNLYQLSSKKTVHLSVVVWKLKSWQTNLVPSVHWSLSYEKGERERVETRLLITRRIHLPRLQKARENKTVAANYPLFFFFFASFWSLAEKLWGNILISFKMQLSLPKCDWILSQLWSFFTFYKSDSAEHSDEVIYFPTDYKISKSF